MLKLENVSKKYGNFVSAHDLNFEIKRGEIVGLLGSNGAGKSTTMNMITGYIPCTSGNISIFDCDIQENSKDYKKHIGYLPEIPPLYLDMTVSEQLEFACGLKSIDKKDVKGEVERVCLLANVLDVKNRMIKNLSKGYRQRVGLAQTLIASPELLILDEPTVGLDPNQIIDLRELIKSLQKNHTIIISSHVLSEIASICNRLIIMKKGEILANDSVENLHNKYCEENVLIVRIKGDKLTIDKAVSNMDKVLEFSSNISVEQGCFDYNLTCDIGVDVRDDIFDMCEKTSSKIMLMNFKNPTLEDIFIKLTR